MLHVHQVLWLGTSDIHGEEFFEVQARDFTAPGSAERRDTLYTRRLTNLSQNILHMSLENCPHFFIHFLFVHSCI